MSTPSHKLILPNADHIAGGTEELDRLYSYYFVLHIDVTVDRIESVSICKTSMGHQGIKTELAQRNQWPSNPHNRIETNIFLMPKRHPIANGKAVPPSMINRLIKAERAEKLGWLNKGAVDVVDPSQEESQ